MGGDAGTETSDGMGTDGFADEFAVSERVEHGGMCAQVSAPAHAHGGEYGNGVVGDDAFGNEARNQTERSAYGTKSCYGEGDKCTAVESEQPVEYDVDFVGEPCDDGYAFVGGTCVGVRLGIRAEGEHHDDGRNAEHTGNDGKSDVDAALAAVE